ncbi:hypothetical protein QD46_24485 [Paenibacillus polymyxa]|nr:hypothetical protein QD46_24485 [Paenibacillus polymyxa]
MLKKLQNPIFLICLIFLFFLTWRIIYHPPHFIYDWLMGSCVIRLIGRKLYEKYQDTYRTSVITDTIVELIMVMISFGIILFLFMSQETWLHKLFFILVGESTFLIYSGVTFKEILQKNKVN